MMCALPFWPSIPPNGAGHRLCPSAGRAQVRLRAAYLVQSLSYLCTARDASGSGIGHVYQTRAGSKHGELSCSHGTFLHITLHVAQSHSQSPSIHYISRDHPNAHELTNHIPHPSPAPGRRSPGAPGKTLRRWYGMVPVSPTGTTASFPRML